MAKLQPSKPKARPRLVENMDVSSQILALAAKAQPDVPLPTTREFGKRLGIAGATAYRVLQGLFHSGEIWQHPVNGRYYPASARGLLDRPKPIGCLIRRLELDSEQYRELLEGISLGCGGLQRSMLLWHDEMLVNHRAPREAPVFASASSQRAILKEFLDRHGESAGGFVLDHVWADAALREFRDRLKPAVMLFRACNLDGFSGVRANFHAGSLKALTHLLGRGFERIVPVRPFSGDPAIEEFFSALQKAEDETGCSERIAPVVTARTEAERSTLVKLLHDAAHRTALLCPEDNVSALLAADIRAAGISCPLRVGVLSMMGTDVAINAKLSCLRYDFRMMGRLAVEALGASEPQHHILEPRVCPSETT